VAHCDALIEQCCQLEIGKPVNRLLSGSVASEHEPSRTLGLRPYAFEVLNRLHDPLTPTMLLRGAQPWALQME
jgi:hypothetical protein